MDIRDFETFDNDFSKQYSEHERQLFSIAEQFAKSYCPDLRPESVEIYKDSPGVLLLKK